MKKKIRVLLEANKILSGRHDGIHRYVRELLQSIKNLIAEDEQWHIDIFMGQVGFYTIVNIRDFFQEKIGSSISEPRSAINKFKRINTLLRLKDTCIKFTKIFLPKKFIQNQKRMKSAFHAFMFNRYPSLKFNNYDVVHMTLPQSYPYFKNCQANMVTTVHDLTHLHFPKFHLRENINNTEHGMLLATQMGSEFIAVSNATKDDLLSNYPIIDSDVVHVVYEACNVNQFKPSSDPDGLAAVRLKYGIPKYPFILSLSILEPRKNLINSIKAFSRLINEHPELLINFVIAGEKGWKHDALFNLATLQPDRLRFTGFVDDSDLAKLYSAATAFSYVSFYEGFGLPALEAMSCGTPVVYGRNSAMPEIIGEGGLAVDPNDINDIKEKYKILAMNKNIRDKTAKIALERSRQFSWEITAKHTLEVYKKVAGRTF